MASKLTADCRIATYIERPRITPGRSRPLRSKSKCDEDQDRGTINQARAETRGAYICMRLTESLLFLYDLLLISDFFNLKIIQIQILIAQLFE